MKEIFKHIEGRDWDWFGSSEKGNYEINELGELEILWAVSECDNEHYGWKEFSLADLLANKSWCQAVWGDRGWTCEGKGNSCEHWPDKDHRRYAWDGGSIKAFQILQQQGKEACINYITKTMR